MPALLESPNDTETSSLSADDSAPELNTDRALADNIVPSRGGVSAVQTLMIAGLCLLFLYHNYLPLFHSDLWGHVSYGEWILQYRQLPAEDPFTPLAEGVPVVATAWLSQVIFALATKTGDVESLAHLFALTVLVTHLFLLRSFILRGANLPVAMTAVTVAFLIAWSRHAVQRPEVFGSCCFAALLWLLSREETSARNRWSTLAILPLFALWANLHGSFIMGFAVLGCCLLGHIFDSILLRGWQSMLSGDGRLHRDLLRLELAVAGTLVNPYGMDLLVYSLAFPGHPNLSTVLEWFPLEMKSLEGIPMAASWFLTAVVLRHSHRRMTGTEVLLLLVFNLAVCARVRMIAWYAPVLLWALAPHMQDIAQRWFAHRSGPLHWTTKLNALSPRWAAVAVLLVWMTFALSPISRPILGGKRRPPQQVFSHDTPLGVTQYLQQHPPAGMVAAPQWWGDWLTRHSHAKWHVMATTNAIHLLPQQVWNDCLSISIAEGGLERRLDRYRINTVIVGKALQPELERTIARLPGWKTVFEDDIGLIAVRTRAVPETSRSELTSGPSTASSTEVR